MNDLYGQCDDCGVIVDCTSYVYRLIIANGDTLAVEVWASTTVWVGSPTKRPGEVGLLILQGKGYAPDCGIQHESLYGERLRSGPNQFILTPLALTGVCHSTVPSRVASSVVCVSPYQLIGCECRYTSTQDADRL